LSSNTQTLTPNPDTIYINPFFDTRSGPMVLEIPPADGGSITGSIDDCWQSALADVGLAGVDQGAGGKYLIVPPDFDEEIPADYIAVRSDTYQGFAILRSNIKTAGDAEIARAVAYGKRVRFYPWARPGETRFVDLADVLYDCTIPYDTRFFRSLARMVEYEPWLERDKAMIDPLRSLGIAKGVPFAPDDALVKQLDEAAREARAWIDARYETLFEYPFYPGEHWAVPALPEVVKGVPTLFAAPDSYPIDGRGITYAMGYFSAKHLGTGQYYLMTIRDRDGRPLAGDATYRLHVPPDAPVDLYWSATAYDRGTHALLRGMSRSSRASNSEGLLANADGSIDLWFAPRAPAGKESNWVPTRADRGFEVLFRAYGPRRAFFDKSWVLPDLVKIH
jgi:hypothetical protein